MQHDYIKWEKSENAVTFYPKHLEKYSSTALMEVTDTVKYPKEYISKIYVDEYDQSKTIMGIAVLAVFIGIVAIIASTYTFRIYE